MWHFDGQVKRKGPIVLRSAEARRDTTVFPGGTVGTNWLTRTRAAALKNKNSEDGAGLM